MEPLGPIKIPSRSLARIPTCTHKGYFCTIQKIRSQDSFSSSVRPNAHPCAVPLINKADFIACHQFNFTEKWKCWTMPCNGATFLLNSPYDKEKYGINCPDLYRKTSSEKLKVFVIDATSLPGTMARQAASIPSCKPAILHCQAYCLKKMPSNRSKKQLKKPISKREKSHRTEFPGGGFHVGKPA